MKNVDDGEDDYEGTETTKTVTTGTEKVKEVLSDYLIEAESSWIE